MTWSIFWPSRRTKFNQHPDNQFYAKVTTRICWMFLDTRQNKQIEKKKPFNFKSYGFFEKKKKTAFINKPPVSAPKNQETSTGDFSEWPVAAVPCRDSTGPRTDGWRRQRLLRPAPGPLTAKPLIRDFDLWKNDSEKTMFQYIGSYVLGHLRFGLDPIFGYV